MDLFVVAGVAALIIPSITSHEAAHGYVADRLGDPTARERGRLTLNPIPHIDPMFTIAVPLFLLLSGAGVIFGGAKPVPVDVSRLRNPRRDWALVALAGPATNLAVALVLSAVFAILIRGEIVPASSRVAGVLATGIYVNALLVVFNLLPIPPLDGSRVVQFFLSGAALRGYRQLERFGLLLVLAFVFFFPPGQEFLVRAVGALTLLVTSPFGVSRAVAMALGGLAG
ncbi:MAG: site-2 protease family protein [Gemmatimonadetes bacterium]|nr:site-2 protease family protein [Gemmatimonadota bacterium]